MVGDSSHHHKRFRESDYANRKGLQERKSAKALLVPHESVDSWDTNFAYCEISCPETALQFRGKKRAVLI
ncbi:MAG: hypothetical protein MSIBF_03405 [Candidatus Altiarchaeales archaeon IMC4]|nr:MAG: hypothetical protein MSIBF_03405 [Candidatus Altiarchaeales archaeon IMC4]